MIRFIHSLSAAVGFWSLPPVPFWSGASPLRCRSRLAFCQAARNVAEKWLYSPPAKTIFCSDHVWSVCSRGTASRTCAEMSPAFLAEFWQVEHPDGSLHPPTERQQPSEEDHLRLCQVSSTEPSDWAVLSLEVWLVCPSGQVSSTWTNRPTRRLMRWWRGSGGFCGWRRRVIAERSTQRSPAAS